MPIAMCQSRHRSISRLLQRNAALGVTGVTFFLLACGPACADAARLTSLAAADANPALVLYSPVHGLNLPSTPAGPPDTLSKLRRNFNLTYDDNHRTAAELRWFTQHPDYLNRVFIRAQRYLPYIAAELERRDMPLELALLPIVESAYDPFAYSHGRAAGLWQMIPGTAKRFGIKQNWWYDGRRDVVDSTRAALDYLEYLHDLNKGDWLNAIASYNSGEGNVLRAARRNRNANKPTDFWHLKLPKETSMYVPKLLAATYLARYADQFDLDVTLADPYVYDLVWAPGSTSLALIGETMGLPRDRLRELNPQLIRGMTPPGNVYPLRIPVGLGYQAMAALAAPDRRSRGADD